MKSCLGLLFALFLFVAVIGGGALIWYLSDTAEFTRPSTPGASASAPGAPPKAFPMAIPVRPAAPANKPPVAIPVR